VGGVQVALAHGVLEGVRGNWEVAAQLAELNQHLAALVNSAGLLADKR